MELKIISKHIVKPAEATFNGLFPLAELDYVSVVTHAYYIYFYNRPIHQHYWCDPSTNKVINTLKTSLSRALVTFYPLAGRLSWIGGGRVKLDCNAMGAELIEVESTMKIADFGDFYSSSENFHDLLPKIDYCEKPIEELPLLAVQVTRFECGGLSVGFAISHVVADGRSAFHFTNEWARLARGEPLEVATFLDRRILLARDDVDEPITREVDDDGGSMKYFRQVGLGKVGDNVTPIFKLLTNDIIQSLKEVANKYNHETLLRDNGRPYSRFEAITAYVWRLVCKARELKDEDITTLIVVVDARSRMDPPLPSSYFGNATIDVYPSSFVGELMSKPLSYACSKIREATNKVNNKCVLKSIKFIKSQKSLRNYQSFEDRGKQYYSPPYVKHCDVQVVSWLNLRCSGVDFGWGVETYMGPPMVHGSNGSFFITPYKNDGSVVIGLFLGPTSTIQNSFNSTIQKCYSRL